ncbi:MFS transporter [Kitasatospora sp. NPDC056783]|uniref:MFS transporter n=1 Tax=Kitasatospora sp. NPDC056783 TaxID=3345943 RepID=UPI003683B5C2
MVLLRGLDLHTSVKVDASGMQRSSSKISVLVLACALFVVTTSEFQVSAMLGAMSRDLGVPVGDLGLLVTAYSLGMGLGGPVVAWCLRGVGVRAGLVLVLGCYAVVEAMAGVAGEEGALLVLRVVTGALSGAAFGMALSAAMGLGSVGERARGSAVVLGGLMAGTLFGLPLSHLLASTLGWRASFFLLAVGAAVMALAVFVCLPESVAGHDGPPSSGELRDGRLWLCYLSSFLTIGGVFAAFAFIDPILRGAGLGSGRSTLTMLGFGGAAFLVNRWGGRVRAGAARPWLLAGLVVQLAALLVLVLAPGRPLPVVVAVVLLGGTGIALNPLLVNRVVAVADPGVLVNTVHTSAITLGVAAATTLGSRAITAGGGDLRGTLLIGVGFTVAALVLVAVGDAGARHPGRGRAVAAGCRPSGRGV